MPLKRLTTAAGEVHYALVGTDHTGARFYLTLRRPDGSYCSYREARQVEADTTLRIGKRSFVRPALRRIAFGELWDRYIASIRDSVRPATLQNYQDRVRPHVLPLLRDYQVGRADFRELIRGNGGLIDTLKSRSYRGKPMSYRYINKVLAAVRSAFDFARREGYVDENPIERADRPRESSLPLSDPRRRDRQRMRVIPLATMEKFLSEADPGKQRAAILLGLCFGLRPGEIRAIQWGEIDWAGRAVNVTRAASDIRGHGTDFYDPKTVASNAKVPLDPELEAYLKIDAMAELKAWRLASPHSKDEDLIVYNRAGKPFNKEGIDQTVIQPVYRRTGLEHRTPYDLRHTYASLLIHLGRHPKHVQVRMRHTNFNITMSTYGHLFEEAPPGGESAPPVERKAK